MSENWLPRLGAPLRARRSLLTDLLGSDLDWVTHDARCADTDTPDTFHPAGGPVPDNLKALCDTCPLVEPCLAYALRSGVQGVWGGTSDRERRRATRKAKVA